MTAQLTLTTTCCPHGSDGSDCPSLRTADHRRLHLVEIRCGCCGAKASAGSGVVGRCRRCFS